jgi:hypothetical protein
MLLLVKLELTNYCTTIYNTHEIIKDIIIEIYAHMKYEMKKFYLGPKFGTSINRKWITNIWVVTKTKAKCSSRKREHSLNDKSEK